MASYADLIAKRTTTAARTIRKPLLLEPAAYDTFLAAKQAYQDHLLSDAMQQGKGGPPVKMNGKSPTAQAREAMEAAEAAMLAVSYWLHFRVPQAGKVEEIRAKVNAQHDVQESPTQWNIAYLCELFDHAETVEGERVDDFTVTSLANELAAVTAGTLADMMQAVLAAQAAPDFPTSLR